jgi:hypothetical protein
MKQFFIFFIQTQLGVAENKVLENNFEEINLRLILNYPR